MRGLSLLMLGALGAAVSMHVVALPAALAQGGAAVAEQAAATPVDMKALAGERLPTHPELVAGKLENGLAYVIKRHGNPPGRISIQMHIASGSLNETDRQRGIAHYLEHMAFNGSENFAPGELIPFFESIGLTFGRHQNAFTSFDQTVYQLALPNTQEETISKGLLFFSDVLGRLSLLPEEIEKERQVILEERRSGLGADQRMRDIYFPRIFAGSRIGVRLPIGVEETIQGVQKDDFADYLKRWYTTGNATVVAVGDVDPEMVAGLIKEHFGNLPAGARPAAIEPGVPKYGESFAVVATDKEARECSVSIVGMAPPSGPSVTAADLRRDLVDQVSSQVFNRRLQAKVAAGEVSFRRASGFAADVFGAARWSTVQASGKPEQWRAMLTDLGAELQKARTFGFTERELDDVRKGLLAQFRQLAAMENTLPAQAIVGIIVRSVNDREPVMSMAQTLEYMERLLPTLTAAEVSRVFHDTFDTSRVAFLIETTEGEHAPSEAALLAAGLEAISAEVTAEEETDRPERLMAELPEPGKVVEMEQHPASQVNSFWLDNGVRVHHRYMDYRENQATITITLAGGRIEEAREHRGYTAAAALAMSRPATGKLTSTNIRDLLTGKSVSVGGGAGPDSVSISITGAPQDLEAGMQVAHLLLTDAKIEQAGFDQWKLAQVQSIEARKKQPRSMASEILPDLVYPKDDPRMRPLEVDEVNALELGPVQAWLDALIDRAPIEVSVVGHIDQDEAMELVTRYVGSLSERKRMHENTLVGYRRVKKAPGPYTREVAIDTQTPQAMVMCAFFGADEKNVEDTRLLDMAARIISTRMIKRIREDEQLVYSIGSFHQPASAYPGFGLFAAGAPTEPAKAQRLAEVIQEMFAEFAATGPTEAEVVVAKGQFDNTLDESMKEPGFWTRQLGDMTYRGVKLDDVVAAPEAIQGYTAQQIHKAFQKHYKPEEAVRIVVTPKGDEAAGG